MSIVASGVCPGAARLFLIMAAQVAWDASDGGITVIIKLGASDETDETDSSRGRGCGGDSPSHGAVCLRAGVV